MPPLSFSRSSCFANRRGNDALRGRFRLQVTPRARAAAGWKRGQVEPFRLRTRLAGKRKPRPSTTIPLDPASPGGKRAAIGFGQSQTRVPRVRIGIMGCLGYSLPYWLPGLIGLGLRLNPIECGTVPYWMRVVGREVGWQARLSRFRLRWRAVAIATRGCVVIPSHPPPLAVAASAAKPPSAAWPHPLKKRILRPDGEDGKHDAQLAFARCAASISSRNSATRFCCGRGSVAASANNFAILLFGAIAGFTGSCPKIFSTGTQ